ncbi:MAG: autotransporter outer membrane beta-barrel domain-containing protein [Bdellovibrionales bacterium]|nr:autotransporter outer membrane beta-barrel domain-containing protein [Bdellovibrionales bacterium]MBT3525358.1 autotransporter outer membrane beta-barrel domain-containing protein [Bdellovibrionales bacterium]MBT7669436.1 autotransporter outer membrane beta-barrel domain-containing protein [Bdellovibrionales bacterium]MBT7766839.1 autotransporter outer membrane beta-barrel domain-containing protein [Bdellovibrionales bacterium]
MKVKNLLIYPMTLSFLAGPMFAGEIDLSNLKNDIASNLSIGVEGELSSNFVSSDNNGNSNNFGNSFVSLNFDFQDRVRAVLTANLELLFNENSMDLADDFNLAEFIQEAYIEIKDVNGAPVAFIIGKHAIAFGQNVQEMPLFSENPMADLQEVSEVIGLTVTLENGLFGLFDQAEISIFETEAGDLDVGEINGASVRLSKEITDQIQATLSHVANGDDERRTSLGLITESSDGKLMGWVEGVMFSNNPDFDGSEVALTVGGKISVTDTTDVVVEYTSLNNQVHQLAAGAKVALTENMTLGAEVRYSNYVEELEEDDLAFGVNLTYTFGGGDDDSNEEYLFDGDNN